MSLFIIKKIFGPKTLRPFYINELLHSPTIVPLKKIIKTQNQTNFLRKQIAFDKTLLKKFQLFRTSPIVSTKTKNEKYDIEIELPIPVERKNLSLKIDSEKGLLKLKILTKTEDYHQNYVQKIKLPNDILYDKMEATMDEDGKLRIEIQRKTSYNESINSKSFQHQYKLHFDFFESLGFKDRPLIEKLIKKHKGNIQEMVPEYIKTSLK